MATDWALEEETTVTLSSGEELVQIWTARRKDITALRKKSAVFTEIASGFDGVHNWAEFTCELSRFNIASAARPKRERTEAQKLADKAAGERLRKARAQS